MKNIYLGGLALLFFSILPILTFAHNAPPFYGTTNVTDGQRVNGAYYFSLELEEGITDRVIRSGPYRTYNGCQAARDHAIADSGGSIVDEVNGECDPYTTSVIIGQWTYRYTSGQTTLTSSVYDTEAACSAARVSTPGAEICTQSQGLPPGASVEDGAGRGGTPIAITEARYTFLAPLPGFTDTELVAYLIQAVKFLIAVAGAIGVVRLVICGFKLVLAPGSHQREEAKECLWKIILGLLLALSGFVLLQSINPELTKPKFDPPATLSATSTANTNPQPRGCPTCVNLSVSAKPPGQGCALPGPCQIASVVNDKLVTLQGLISGWWVTESYPPTRVHKDSCHPNGTCVDADYTDNRTGAADIVNFIVAAQRAGLRAVYEVSSQADYDRILPAIRAAGLPAGSLSNQRGWITGNHFSVYNN